jgi:non-ribosomal peptide synthetase component F
MGRNDNPWEQVAALAGIAALAGAGVGAGSALMFAERRAGAQDREIESLAQRVTLLERLNERVTRLEWGTRSPAQRSDTA